jgi:hypothetical protein
MNGVTQDVPRPVLSNTAQNCCRRIDSGSILPMTLGGQAVEKFTDVWHVARVEAGKEPAFVTDLLRYGLPFFMPWHTIKKKYQNRLTRVSQQAAFKGYCFISGDEAIDLAHDRCRGYLTFMQDLRGEAMQASIRRDVFNLYRLLLNDSVLTPEEFARGTLVRVKDRKHALFGVIGRVTEHEAGKRLTIDVEIFGQSVSTEIEDELAVEIVDT